jgi:hypothetical protein
MQLIPFQTRKDGSQIRDPSEVFRPTWQLSSEIHEECPWTPWSPLSFYCTMKLTTCQTTDPVTRMVQVDPTFLTRIKA